MAGLQCRSKALTIALLAIAGWCRAGDWEIAADAYRRGDFASAARQFEALRGANPALDAAASSMLGLCQLRLGATDDALANLHRAVERDPSSARYRVALVQGLVAADRWLEADETAWAVDVSRLGPQERTALALLQAQALNELGDVQMAASVLSAQIGEDDANPALHRALGFALARAGDAEAAFAQLSCAFALDPGAEAASARRAVQLARELARAGGPSAPAWRDRAASVAAALGWTAPTVDNLRLAGTAAAEADREEDAVEWLSRARVAAPDDPVVAIEIGQALVKAGRTSDGESELRRAVTLGPAPEIARRAHGQLARLMARSLRIAEAAQEFRSAGESARADEMAAIADAWSASLERAEKLRSDLGQMRAMAHKLEELGDMAGVTAIEQRSQELERELAEIEANLARVRAAFADL